MLGFESGDEVEGAGQDVEGDEPDDVEDVPVAVAASAELGDVLWVDGGGLGVDASSEVEPAMVRTIRPADPLRAMMPPRRSPALPTAVSGVWLGNRVVIGVSVGQLTWMVVTMPAS